MVRPAIDPCLRPVHRAKRRAGESGTFSPKASTSQRLAVPKPSGRHPAVGVRLSAAELAGRLAQHAEAVCRLYLSNGRRYGCYWRVGDIANTPGQSLYVCLRGQRTGKWCDAATGEYGDLLDLIALTRKLPSFKAALAEARQFLDLPADLPRARAEPVASDKTRA